MITNYDFAQDVDPVKFILEEQVVFLHKIKKYATILDRLSDEDKIKRFSRLLGAEMNRYGLVLNSCEAKIPKGEAQGLLCSLLAFLDQAWEERNTAGKDMVGIVDNACLAYCSLADYLRNQKLSTK